MGVIVWPAIAALLVAAFAALGLFHRARITETAAFELAFAAHNLEHYIILEEKLAERAWWTALGVGRDASLREIDAAYRARIKGMHPDLGGAGDTAGIERLQRARDEGRREVERARRRAMRREVPGPLDPPPG